MLDNKNCTSRYQKSANFSSDDCSREHPVSFLSAVDLSTSVIIAVLSPSAVVANALILATIWKRTFTRTSFHFLLSGLALTDFFTGLLAQPFFAASCLTNLINIRTIGESSSAYFIAITLIIITLMSVERWLYMSQTSFSASRRRYFFLIMVFFLPIPATVISVLANHKDPAYEYVFAVTTAVEMSCCFLVTLFSYFKVYRILRHHQQQIRAHWGSQNFGQPTIDFSKNKKSVATMVYILLLFSVCFIPYIVAAPLKFTLDSKYEERAFVAEKVSMVLLFLSSTLNPGLYVWRMRDIRTGLKQLFGRSS